MIKSNGPAPCGVMFRHDWHGYLGSDGRTRVCDGEITAAPTTTGAEARGGQG